MTSPDPNWGQEVTPLPSVHTPPPEVPGAGLPDQTQLLSWGKDFIEGIVRQVVLAVTGVILPGPAGQQLANWALGILDSFDTIFSAFDGIDLTDPGSILHAIATALEDIPVVGELAALLDNLVNGGQPINVLNLFGQLTQGLFGVVPASSISSNNPNLLNNGGFDGSISMDGSGVWTYDATTGHTSNGSAMTTADGTLKALLSNAVDVTVGQKLTPTVWVKSSGYAGTGTPIRLAVKTYLNGAAVSGANIASGAGPGGTWTQMSGTFTVPSGVDSVRLRLVVDTTATGGSIWFDDGSLTKPGNGPFDGILQLFGLTALEDLFDGLNIDDIWSAIISVILNPLGLLEDAIGRGNLVDALTGIFGSMTGGATPSVLTDLLTQVLNALQNIPFLNVTGVGGPADIGASVQSTWDQWISGLVGVLGTGSGLADIFNVGQQVSSSAAQGSMAFDIAGIRNNSSLNTGFLPTTQSNVNLDQLALQGTAPTFAITQSTAITGYQRIAQESDYAVVSWQGYGITSVTDCYINIYKMDTTTGLNTLVQASTNQIGLLSGGSSPLPVVYTLSTPIHVVPGDVYGIEIAVRGAGTHNIVGTASWLQDQTVYPRRYSSVRNSGTSAAPSTFTPTYGSNVPFLEFGVSASSIALPHSPVINTLAAGGSLGIPAWANTVQVITLGGGGGGALSSAWGINGNGGDSGHYSTATWVRGTDFTGTPTITVTVGAGGVGGALGAPTNGHGGDGTSSTAAIAALSLLVTGTGGTGATGTLGDRTGDSPGNQTVDSVVYNGGAAQGTGGGPGSAPGGGGAGGDGGSVQAGGAGAAGVVWIRFKQ